MHVNCVEAKATGAAMVIELGYVPSYAIIKNVTSGKQVEYVNTRIGKSQMSIDAGDVVNDIDEFTDYVGADGILATDSKISRTAVDTLGVVQATSAGLLIAAGLTDINDTATEQLLIIAFRSEA